MSKFRIDKDYISYLIDMEYDYERACKLAGTEKLDWEAFKNVAKSDEALAVWADARTNLGSDMKEHIEKVFCR